MDKKFKILIGFLGVILCFVIMLFVYYSFFLIKINNENIRYSDDLQLEVYQEAFVSDFIVSIDGELLEDTLIDTTQLGEQQIQFLYQDKNKKKSYGSFVVSIVDTTEPTIFLNPTYSLEVDSDIVLTDVLMSVDNYDSHPMREILGDYDIHVQGDYSLIYQVTDSSGNVSRREFTLNVYDPEEIEEPFEPEEESYIAFEDVLQNYKEENTLVGIDVSKWQGDIDYAMVKDAGAEFVMVRVGYQDGMDGDSIVDPYFEQNIIHAIQNGFRVGVYYYSHANDMVEANYQAEWVLEQISSYSIDLPVVFDWENWSHFNSYSVSLYDINLVADTFLRRIEKAGYQSMLYGSKYYLENIWEVKQKNIWLAHYTSQTNYESSYQMWQLCSDGKISGIESYVDIDVMYVS